MLLGVPPWGLSLRRGCSAGPPAPPAQQLSPLLALWLPSLGTHPPPPVRTFHLTSESGMPLSALPPQIYGGLSAGEFQLIRQTLLIFFQDLHVRVSEWAAWEHPAAAVLGRQGASLQGR